VVDGAVVVATVEIGDTAEDAPDVVEGAESDEADEHEVAKAIATTSPATNFMSGDTVAARHARERSCST
jgi:hypothetical protein